MTRVPYGIASSSCHAIRSFLKFAKADEILTETSKAIQRDLFVDEILTEAPSEREAKQFQPSMINTMKKGQFNRRKWTCSEPRFTSSLPLEYHKANDDLDFCRTRTH